MINSPFPLAILGFCLSESITMGYLSLWNSLPLTYTIPIGIKLFTLWYSNNRIVSKARFSSSAVHPGR